MATHNVTFKVVSGPGHLIGAHNGDVSSHEPNHGPDSTTAWRSAYHGLVRAVVQVSKDCATPKAVRQRMREIDGAASADLVVEPEEDCHVEPIVLEAYTPGLPPVRVSIPTSVDPKDSVFAVAEATAGIPVVIN